MRYHWEALWLQPKIEQFEEKKKFERVYCDLRGITHLSQSIDIQAESNLHWGKNQRFQQVS